MQQNQRFILFLILSMGLFFAWFAVGPKLFPGLFPQPRKPPEAAKTEKTKTAKSKKTIKSPAGKTAGGKTVAVKSKPVVAPRPKTGNEPVGKKKTDTKVAKKKEKKQKSTPPGYKPDLRPAKSIVLGSSDPKDGYFIEAEISPNGAAVNWIKLNDERYRTVADRDEQLKVVGSGEQDRRTFDLFIKEIDDKLKAIRRDASLNSVRWKSEGTEKTNNVITAAAWSFSMPGDPIKIIKRYSLVHVKEVAENLRKAQDQQAKGYELKFELEFVNTAEEARKLKYSLQGPVGVPLEDLENVRVFRTVVTGLISDGGKLVAESTTAATIVESEAEEEWTLPIQYIGIDVQYFAALLIPGKDDYFEVARPQIVSNKGEDKHADITLILDSKELTIPAKADGKDGTLKHKLTLYAGPKRKSLLDAYEAEDTIQYGWFSWVARGMLWLLNVFHGIGLPYGIAVICLTFVVRGALFPLSRKQVASARKMKELQPQIAELKKKYANDREKMARAQMELFSKAGYNPFAGCLPIFLQLPIFIGLYQALSNAVELRLAPFPLSWIDNLAAPDALIPDIGFRIPFLGSSFNLLPIITIFLFVAQQKMFMPPPTDEQTAMQQKMMMYMSIFFGFLFYRVPSGLCIYFIASSIWGIAERKILDAKGDPEPPPDDGKGSGSSDNPDESPRKGFFAKLMDMADQAAAAKAQSNGNARDDQSTQPQRAPKGGGGKKKKGKRKRR